MQFMTQWQTANSRTASQGSQSRFNPTFLQKAPQKGMGASIPKRELEVPGKK